MMSRMPHHPASLVPTIADPAAIARRLAGGPLLVGLDFDGTLAPIVDRPEGARIDAAMRERLARLAALVPTAVVSGRDLEDLYDRVAVPGLTLVGSHGVEIAHRDGRVERAAGLERSDATLGALVDRLRHATALLSGVLVEPKRHSVAVHWRLAGPLEQAEAERLVETLTRDFPAFAVGTGKMVAEFRPAIERDKGGAIAVLRAESRAGGPEPAVLYVGDDVTDEDAFRTLDRSRDCGVLVANPPRPSAAEWCIPDIPTVGVLLDRLIAALGGAAATP